MYCNITQLSVKKKNIKEIKIIFLCTVHFWAALSPPSYPWAKMCTRFCQYLKDSSAQLYDPISRFSPGSGEASHLDVDHHQTNK